MGEEKVPQSGARRGSVLTSEDEASMDQISPKAQPSMAAMEEGRAEVPGGDPVDGVSLVASLPRRESATDEARPADAVARQSARRNSRTALMDQMAHLAAGREGGAVAPVDLHAPEAK